MTDFVKNPLPEENKVIYRGFYEDGDTMRVVRVQEGIEEIAENAFRDLEALEEVYLPKSLKRISACAFVSPASTLPPTNSHKRPRALWAGR